MFLNAAGRPRSATLIWKIKCCTIARSRAFYLHKNVKLCVFAEVPSSADEVARMARGGGRLYVWVRLISPRGNRNYNVFKN